MANTYTLIASNTLSSSAASVTFSAIPNTYTDLILKISVRDTQTGTALNFRLDINSVSADNSRTYILGDGASATSARNTANTFILGNSMVPAASATSNTFGNIEVYIPNYAGSTVKPVSIFGVSENNATTSYINATAGLHNRTAAISSLYIEANTNFVSGSSFFLYGIKNS